ncbi:MAG: DUF2167 domain-containing protein [Kofleriaceae bacterium]
MNRALPVVGLVGLVGLAVGMVGTAGPAEARPKRTQAAAPTPVEVAKPDAATAGDAADDAPEELPEGTVAGPRLIDLGSGVEIDLPAGFFLVDQDHARRSLEANGDNADHVLAIVYGDGPWSMSVELADLGYVSDADAGQLEAGPLLQAIRAGTEAQNRVRQRKGIEPLLIDGWSQPPAYDRAHRTLTWGIRAHDGAGAQVSNEMTNVLGRRGYIGLVLVAEPDTLDAARAEAQPAMAAIHWRPGHRYEDFDPATDRHSGLSLSNLVVGGAAVAAASKLGVFAAIAMILKKLFVVIAAAFAGMWKWLTGRRKNA